MHPEVTCNIECSGTIERTGSDSNCQSNRTYSTYERSFKKCEHRCDRLQSTRMKAYLPVKISSMAYSRKYAQTAAPVWEVEKSISHFRGEHAEVGGKVAGLVWRFLPLRRSILVDIAVRTSEHRETVQTNLLIRETFGRTLPPSEQLSKARLNAGELRPKLKVYKRNHAHAMTDFLYCRPPLGSLQGDQGD
jgi:hypothetical protein